MKRFLTLGIKDEYPDYLKEKLRISNVILIIVSLVALLYGGAIGLKMPEMRFIPGVSVVGVLVGYGAASVGLHRLYRLLLCGLPIIVVFLYHIGVVPVGKPALPSSVAMMLAFSVLPFIVFDVREKLELSFSVILGFFVLISFKWTNGWLETGIDDEPIRTGSIQEVGLTISFIILSASVYFLNQFTYRAEQKRLKLMEEAEQRNEELHQKGQELEVQMQKLEVAQQEEKQRNWAAEGFSQFGTILRQHDDLGKLYDTLIASLVKYVKANQGALYVVEEEDNTVLLELKACYAYNRKKFKENTIEPGQGLVGQCYLERDIVYMTKVPQGYTFITSGLGDATPASVLIVPLITNEKVEGIIEFASFKVFDQHEIAFVKKLGEDIAATLSVGRINALTRELLANAQEQAEEMRAQEEEMRQNMEELSATQEEMQRKEQEYLRKIAELEATQKA
jgi:putative methionine-R-sulfoxide reductase with GAF domain